MKTTDSGARQSREAAALTCMARARLAEVLMYEGLVPDALFFPHPYLAVSKARIHPVGGTAVPNHNSFGDVNVWTAGTCRRALGE